ncbi:BCL2 interacting protein 3 isoform X2 [Arctopsyche grandis]|uniref:BCL2 interacting protein 3 isoform X2 n=1 Tax=Arctopsyche grandis TaxID=121162 RepID=UPI00406DA2DF
MKTNRESWVELGARSGTPLPSAAEEYLRLLREAQRESNNSSARQSLASSRIDSPKSPPNSPNTEPSTEDELKGIYINFCGNKEGELNSAQWVWQWSSRPDQLPPTDWNFKHPVQKAPLSLRRARLGGKPLFGRDIIAPLLLSNILSLLIGAGIGIWLYRRTSIISNMALQ